MFLFSTILYFEDSPVGYDLYKHDNGFSFKRAIDTQSELLPAEITVIRFGEDWKLADTDNPGIKEQIIRIINVNEKIQLPEKLSAAS